MYILVSYDIHTIQHFTVYGLYFLFDAKFAWNYVCVHQSMLIMFNKCNCDKFFIVPKMYV